MSRRRGRQGASQDSLELFLDTICNMFGGFVFIMLFVVVSMRQTTDKVYEEAIAEERASAVELQELEAELENLQNQWREVSDRVEQARSIVEALESHEVVQFHNETLDVLDELREVSESNAAKSQEIAALERRGLELGVELKTALAELDEATRRLEAAEYDAASSRRLATRRTSPPQMRSEFGYRRQVGVILKYGRLYVWHKYNGAYETLNTDDFHVVEEKGTSARTEPLPWRGVDLNAPGVMRRLEATFAPFNPKSETIVIIVASDSYEEYGIVRDFLKDRLFRICPMIGPEGVPVYDRGGSDSRSQ
ncbi:MAG: hypothetical protein ACOX0A_07925 [Thermoguttaceae bacterium]|jgi:TolA-binding protein